MLNFLKKLLCDTVPASKGETTTTTTVTTVETVEVAPVVVVVAPEPVPAPIVEPEPKVAPKEVAVWMERAGGFIGLKEIVGPKHNPTILGWAKKLGRKVGIAYTADETPWCGLFVGMIMNASNFEIPDICVRASEWTKFGVQLDIPTYGAVMVFSRTGGGHVGFYVSEDADTFHILGGNQSNGVNITKIAKNRFTEARWPKGIDLPTTGRIVKKFDGELSTNES